MKNKQQIAIITLLIAFTGLTLSAECEKTCTSLGTNCGTPVWLGTNVTTRSDTTSTEYDAGCVNGVKEVREVEQTGDAKQNQNMRCYYSPPANDPNCPCPSSFTQCGPASVTGRVNRTLTITRCPFGSATNPGGVGGGGSGLA
jgi:hypothetical protein